MILSEELQEITAIVAEAGLPALAGDMIAYALAQPKSYFGEDSYGEEIREPQAQIDRAIDFLQFQLVAAESHVHEAESIATRFQENVATSIAFVPPSTLAEEGGESDSRIPAFFAEEKRKETWPLKHRALTIKALTSILNSLKSKD